MKNKLILTCGISGSGKTTLRKELEKHIDIKVVCPDDIRKDVTGNISDQSQNNLVFAIVRKVLKKELETKTCMLEATNLNWSQTKKSIKDYTEGLDITPLVIFMTDSDNLDLCYNRVRKDIKNKVDRSDTPQDVMKKQHKRYQQCFNNAISDPDGPDLFIFNGTNFKELLEDIQNESRKN